MSTLEKIRAEITELFKASGASNSNLCFAVLQLVDKYAEQETCNDVVSRQAVLDQMYEWMNTCEYRKVNATDYFVNRINKLPSVRPQEQTGHWKRISMDRYTTHAQYWYECDKCGEHNLGNTDFCPNCGAYMVESQESEGVRE